MNKNSKLIYISYLRIVAMIMVVYYHCICCYTSVWRYDNIQTVPLLEIVGKFLNCIHIPLFLAISGYLYGYFVRRGKYQDNLEFIKNKALRLLVPFLPWSIVVWLFLSNSSYIDFIINGASYLWFLGTLFVLFMLAMLLKKTVVNNSLVKDMVLFILFGLVSIFTLYIPTNPGLILFEAANYMCVFWAGVLLSKYDSKILEKCTKQNVLLLFLLTVLLLFITCCVVFKGSVHLQKILIVLTAGFSILLFERIKLPPLNNVGSLLDRNCMGVYLIHYIPIHLLLRVQIIQVLLSSYPILHIIVFIIIFGGSLILSELLRRNKYTKILVG